MSNVNVADCGNDPSSINSAQNVFFRYVDSLEKRVNKAAEFKFYTITDEEYDFIFTIFDQCAKFLKLSRGNDIIYDLSSNFNLGFFFSDAHCELGSTNGSADASECIKLESTNENEESANENDERYDQFTFLCDVCDEEFPVINNDFSYSSQLHFSSESHKEIVSIHRKIRQTERTEMSTSLSTAISISEKSFQPSETHEMNVNLKSEARPTSPILELASQAESFSDSKIDSILAQPSYTSDACPSSTISVAEQTFQRFQWIKDNSQSDVLVWCWDCFYYCTLCSVCLIDQRVFDNHVNDQVHLHNLKWKREIDTSEGQSIATCLQSPTGNASAFGVIATPEGKVICCLCLRLLTCQTSIRSHTRTLAHKTKVASYLKSEESSFEVLRKYLDKNANLSIRTMPKVVLFDGQFNYDVMYSANGRWLCTVCDDILLNKDQLLSHTNSFAHKKKSGQFLQSETINAKSVCDDILLNKDQLLSHTNSFAHKKKSGQFLQSETINAKSVSLAKSTTPANSIPSPLDIVIRENVQYCNLCNEQFPGESQFKQHKNEFRHKIKHLQSMNSI